VIADDARNYMRVTRERYDVVISEPSNPWLSGSAPLFTREFFHDVRRVLRPGGRFLQWVELYDVEPDAFLAVLAALRAEFPHIYGFADLWAGGDMLLLSTEQPLKRQDLPVWDALPEPVRGDLRRVDNFSTADLWSLLRFLPRDIDTIVRRAPVINTDDNMYL